MDTTHVQCISDYVNPNIGTIGHLLTATSPAVMLPHGMAQAVPVTTPGIVDRYLADKIYGFSAGPSTVMASVGDMEIQPSKYASTYDHDLETVSPYYYSVLLEDNDINVEYTVSSHALFYKFNYPENKLSNIIVRLGENGEIEICGENVVKGHCSIRGARMYMYAEFSKEYQTWYTWSGTDIFKNQKSQAGSNIGAVLGFRPGAGCVGLKIGVSYISMDQARENLVREIAGWDFELVKQNARDIWNEALGRIEVKGGTKEQKTIFYTALYRSMSRMVNITEYGRYYSGYDNRVHDAENHDFYVNDGIWDTYRCMHPLQLILEPERQMDMVNSYIRMYEQSGWLPSFPYPEGDRPVMIGNHAAAMIADTYMKGYRDFDGEKAYAAMKKNAVEGTMLPWRNGPLTELDKVYLEKGFFPALGKGETECVKEVHPFENRQAVAVTLEHSYDDWCTAQMAGALGRSEDYEYFMKRANNYRNVFDSRIGFMAPKTADGRWVEGFDPKLGGGQGGRAYFAECNSWIYTFHVQHDISGLANLLGGKDKLAARLDALFTEQYDIPKYHFLSQFPDATGLIGQYCQGNEPGFHIPYLYNYALQPWKTQRKVREIMKLWYNDGPLGICGDEDGGAMSSWYVFSAMGFYPVCPGRPVYDIGSPIFEEVRINLGNGKVFTIKAENVSEKDKYIQSAELNGKPLNKSWFAHSDMADGGTLVLHMGLRPNREWGSSPDSVPPSMSDEM